MPGRIFNFSGPCAKMITGSCITMASKCNGMQFGNIWKKTTSQAQHHFDLNRTVNARRPILLNFAGPG